MKLAADLHIHSCLSPCGDENMTPNNIVNMGYIKELEVMAVSDHNTAKNLPAVAKVCETVGILHIPAIEVQSEEDVHMVCYFPDLETCMEFDALIYEKLPDLPNNPKFFGEQLILNEDDEVIGEEPKLLLQGVTMSIDEVFGLCQSMGGACVPAHINRQANSILYTLGFMPETPVFATVEVNRNAPAPDIDLTDKHVLYSSDAHYLENILEREVFIDIPEKSAKAFVEKMRTHRVL